MSSSFKKIHVFSAIPRMSGLIKERLPDVEVVEVKLIGQIEGKCNKEVLEEEIQELMEAEILLIDIKLLAQVTQRLPKLKWAQGTSAGVDSLAAALKDKPKPSYYVTRMVGDAFSQLMAEFAVGWIITHERGWLTARENQLKSDWQHTNNIAYYRSLRDITIGILGMGNIGKEVARSLKTFSTEINAYTRSPPTKENRCEYVDKYWHTGDLADFLQQNDYIINIMPSTPDTKGMFNGDVLKDAKKNAVFMNIGRGDVIGDADVIRALDMGWISSAILDVFSTEPLPAESPLWKHPKIIITPHCAGVSRAEDVAHTFVFNFKRYVEGLPLMYVIDWHAGY